MKAITTEAQYKQYFSSSFQGMNSIINDVLSPIFGEFTPTTIPTGVDYVDEYGDGGANIDHIYDYGKYYTDTTDVSVFEVILSERCHISRARKGIKETVSRITGKYSGAFIVFHYPDGSTNAEAQIWRLSWLKRLDVHREDSPAKRYTYLCGPSYSCRTIAQRFDNLYKEENKTLDSITKAFDAEALSDEFFKEYKVMYDDIVQWITGQRVVKQDNKWKEIGKFGSGNGKTICDSFLKEFNKIEEEEEKTKLSAKAIRDYVKKMLGRLVFIQFLQKKGYLGIDGKPTQNFLLDLFNCITDEQRDDFIDTALEQVVYLLLNSDDRKPGSDIINNHTLDVPFLNGGLFERDRWDDIDVKIPMEFFHNEGCQDVKREFGTTELRPDDKFLTQCGILDLFNHYNFTIDENDPDDAEVGVDPEMLGKIFENLLEDNKEKGAFYTPKEIVQYMCKESLIAFLQTGVENEGTKEAIRKFVSTQEICDNLPDNIDQKLREVKICDPAIGSGAFPMGLLNLLVELREKLEPSTNRCELKKDIIQNNIYGVDIEKGAIDIARLRFWLSIMVDEDVDESKPRPTPLPNFDYKFMQGNSLIESFAGHDLSHILDNEKTASTTIKSKKFNPNQTGMDFSSDDTRQNLQIWLSKYFSLSNHDEKDEYRKLINKSVKSYIEQQGISTSEESLLKDIDPSENQSFFLWHTWFKDVFERDAKGFDIVIGNPPYIQLQADRGKLANLYEPCGFDTFNRGGDIYCLFYERGHQLLKQGGHLCYITSNKWMRAGYGEETRDFLSKKTNPELLIDFAGVKIFESASVDTNILLYAKQANQNKTVCAIANKKNKDKIRYNINDYVQSQNLICAFDSSDIWVVLSPIEQSIKLKIKALGKPLKDWGVKINRGVLTGCNDAFIISTEKRDEILSNCQTDEERERTSELIRPIIKGEDIKRNSYIHAGLWLINTHNGVRGKILRIDINDYPAVKRHLDEYWDRISTRSDKGTTPYNLRNCAYLEDFSYPKIIYPETTQGAYFAYDDSGIYIDKTCFMMVGNNCEYLQKTLSSKLFEFAYKRIFSSIELGENGYQYNKHALEKLPIAPITDKVIETDEDFYHLYGLTYDEILVVDPNTKIEKEEYESTKNK